MGMLCLILFVAAVSLWFFTNEYRSIVGVYAPTCALRTKDFNVIVFIILLVFLWCSKNGSVRTAVSEHICIYMADSSSMLVVLMASFISLLTLSLFSVRGSAVYAILGSLCAFCCMHGTFSATDLKYILSFIAAPAIAFVSAFAVRFILRFLLSRIKIHMITLSFYMRHVIIFCIVFTAAAIGLNWGGFISGINDMMISGNEVMAYVAIIVGAVMLIMMNSEREDSGVFADFSIYAVVSVGFSVAATMLFMSFDKTTSLLDLCPVPLSVSTLVAASVAGTELAQKSRLVDNKIYAHEMIAVTAVPVLSFFLSYLLLLIMGQGAGDAMVGFVVVAASILILIFLGFARYVKGEQINRESTDRILYAQRQQIYEHSRALIDMELKVVLSENQALHNAIEMKKQEVMNVALGIVEQREFLESLNDTVKRMTKTEDVMEKENLVAELGSAIQQRLSYESDVDSQYFYAQAESLHEDFSAKLSENFPNLTQQEKRLATLLRLGFSSKYIASLMNITTKSVEISRYRLRQKLGLAKGDNLVNFIKSI